MTTTSSLERERSPASDMASLASMRSAASFSSSRLAAFSTIEASQAAFSRASFSSAAAHCALHCLAGLLMPGKDWAVKSKARSASCSSPSFSFAQTIIT